MDDVHEVRNANVVFLDDFALNQHLHVVGLFCLLQISPERFKALEVVAVGTDLVQHALTEVTEIFEGFVVPKGGWADVDDRPMSLFHFANQVHEFQCGVSSFSSYDFRIFLPPNTFPVSIFLPE